MDNWTQNIQERVDANRRAILERVSQACQRSDRSPDDVRVVWVTKYVGSTVVRGLLENLELLDIGENRPEIGAAKVSDIGQSAQSATWHLIGPLQSKKARQAAETFDVVHALERVKEVAVLDQHRPVDRPNLQCLLQINVSGEEQKHGLTVETAGPVIEATQRAEKLKLTGLMTMAPFVTDPEEVRWVFQGLREARDELTNQYGVELPDLSMGMTQDFEIAIEEGATMVRIGSALFEGFL